MPVLVSIFTPPMLQDGRLTGIAVQRNQSTPTAAKDVKICGNSLATPQVSNQ
jgi:hypothetical protein